MLDGGAEVLRDVAMATIFGFIYIIIYACTHSRHLANTTESSMCGGDAALCQITLTTCYHSLTTQLALVGAGTELDESTNKSIHIGLSHTNDEIYFEPHVLYSSATVSSGTVLY